MTRFRMPMNVAQEAMALAGHHPRQTFSAFESEHPIAQSFTPLRPTPRIEKRGGVIAQIAADDQFHFRHLRHLSRRLAS